MIKSLLDMEEERNDLEVRDRRQRRRKIGSGRMKAMVDEIASYCQKGKLQPAGGSDKEGRLFFKGEGHRVLGGRSLLYITTT